MQQGQDGSFRLTLPPSLSPDALSGFTKDARDRQDRNHEVGACMSEEAQSACV